MPVFRRAALLGPGHRRSQADLAFAATQDQIKPFEAIFDLLTERAKQFFDNNPTLWVALNGAEELRAQPRFTEYLGWLRVGHSYMIGINRAGALSIPY